ncbi:type II secretion system F family protein [Vibrio sp. SCSIO 43137]|uniref:type II secretion system F family protein n=1 Tax=Vibrio sp. SCSIO 43137 TaxID=3021011 RepID=UPI0023077F5D|nr:type II secretion system F family protein [Vibrio sp. SCSIO 43137]WCE28702.1 type II secretion system F family protein [Vibrio sp. SCSIO 43137]
MIQLVAMLLVLSGVAGCLIFYSSARRQERVQRRLQAVSFNYTSGVAFRKRWSWKSNTSRKLKLQIIGYSSDSSETIFMLVRLMLMVTAAFAWFVHQQLELNGLGIAQCVVSAVVAGILVDRLLDWRVANARKEIGRVLPDALDLMVVCVASGQTLEAAFRTVGNEIKPVSSSLSREWLTTATEMSVMDSPLQALANLDARLELAAVNNMVTTMSQALQYGTPLSKALGLIASDNRQYQLLELEEWVGKIPAKMSFPLVIFIMMPVVVIIVAPVVLRLLESLEQF